MRTINEVMTQRARARNMPYSSVALSGGIKVSKKLRSRLKKIGRVAAAGALLPFAPKTAVGVAIGKKNLKKGASKIKKFAKKNKRALRLAAGGLLLPIAPMAATGALASAIRKKDLQKVKTAMAKAAARATARGSVAREVADQVVTEKFGAPLSELESVRNVDNMQQEDTGENPQVDETSKPEPEKKKSALPILLAAAPFVLSMLKGS